MEEVQNKNKKKWKEIGRVKEGKLERKKKHQKKKKEKKYEREPKNRINTEGMKERKSKWKEWKIIEIRVKNGWREKNGNKRKTRTMSKK